MNTSMASASRAISVADKATHGEGGASAAVHRARSVSESELLFRRILQGIYEGRYVPGQRLVEADLAREYGVTRFILRGAFARLVAEGAIVVSFNRGAHVPRLTRGQVRDTLAVMEHLLTLASALAAPRFAGSPHAGILHRAADGIEAIGPDSDFFEFGRAIGLFFRSIAKVADNEELRRVMTALRVHNIRVQFNSFPTAAEMPRTGELLAIYRAITGGDTHAAETLTRNYFKRLTDDIASLPDRAFAPQNHGEIHD